MGARCGVVAAYGAVFWRHTPGMRYRHILLRVSATIVAMCYTAVPRVAMCYTAVRRLSTMEMAASAASAVRVQLFSLSSLARFRS